MGFCGALTIFAGYALSLYQIEWLWLAIAGFFINWFGDSLDGSLARWRRIERPNYGYFVDHSVDAVAKSSPYVVMTVPDRLRISPSGERAARKLRISE